MLANRNVQLYGRYEGGVCFGLCSEWVKALVLHRRILSQQDLSTQSLLIRAMTTHSRYLTFFRHGAVDQIAPLENFASTYGLTIHHAERFDRVNKLPIIASGIEENGAITLRVNMPGGGSHWVAIGRHNGTLYFFCPNNGLYSGDSQDMRQAVVTISRPVPNPNISTPIDTYMWGRLH